MKQGGISLLLGLLLAATGGCGQKDKVVGPEPSPKVAFPIRSSPQNALLYYAAAWEQRDSARVDTVLALDYVGSSTNQLQTLLFTKQDEVHFMHQFRDDPTVIGVSVVLPPTGTWIREAPYASDPPEWVAFSIPSPRVEVYSTPASIVTGPTAFMEFKFEPTTPAPVSPTDTLWSIVRWTEVAQ